MQGLVPELEEFKPPSRKPWLILAILLIVGAALALRHVFRPFVCHTAEGKNRRSSGTLSGIGTNVPPLKRASAEAPSPGGKPATYPFAVTNPRTRPDTTAVPTAGQTAVNTAEWKRALEEAKAWEQQGDLQQARARYFWVLDQRPMQPELVAAAEAGLGRVHTALVFSPRSMPEKVEYVVKKGDFLQRIARNHGTTVELIEKSNGVRKGGMIRAGDVLKVLRASFSIHVSRRRNDLVLRMNGRFFKRYRVGTGRDDRTPRGTFVIASKDVDPVWWPQGREIPYGHPENILGTRWMALEATGETPKVKGYGIHGTWDESTIGKSETAGCIRLTNRDVEELFALVPLGTPVTIAD